jgi:hypothetical protein
LHNFDIFSIEILQSEFIPKIIHKYAEEAEEIVMQSQEYQLLLGYMVNPPSKTDICSQVQMGPLDGILA